MNKKYTNSTKDAEYMNPFYNYIREVLLLRQFRYDNTFYISSDDLIKSIYENYYSCSASNMFYGALQNDLKKYVDDNGTMISKNESEFLSIKSSDIKKHMHYVEDHMSIAISYDFDT
jgi:hypothetical protein